MDYVSGGLELAAVVQLQLTWSLDDIVAAMEHLLHYHRHDGRALLRVLEARFTPRRLEAQIAESARQQISGIKQAYPISQRPLASYDTLRYGDRRPEPNDPQAEKRDQGEHEPHSGSGGNDHG